VFADGDPGERRLAAGLLVQLLLIPLAAFTDSTSTSDPSSLAILGLRHDQAARRLVSAPAVSTQIADLVGADDGRVARARPIF
jgi:hypothetical protein